MRIIRLFLLLAVSMLLASCWIARSDGEPAPTSTTASKQAASTSWSSKDAAGHVGERGTVCGPVVDTRYATGSNGKPTFLNFDRAYPDHTMVVVIWGSDRGAFPNSPQTYYRGKDVCATGLIESYKGTPEIVARDGGQLEVQR
jgi:DNA/RNA endonuclease YhcR with UshA esterase domain